jgi:hypothetical protein
MLRGQEDEIMAREAYNKHHAPVTDMGFITNDKWGFALGYSPDGLVGEHGLIECQVAPAEISGPDDRRVRRLPTRSCRNT